MNSITIMIIGAFLLAVSFLLSRTDSGLATVALCVAGASLLVLLGAAIAFLRGR